MRQQQIRGLLLEEAMLFLLKASGYKPIYGGGTDDTLEQEGLSLFVKGRGDRHQIDAIADYSIHPPFSNPPRLLLEAKFYDRRKVSLTVIRNAVGIISDVSQFFMPPHGHGLKKVRYHYQYAVVSATNFSRPSQRYAYAHDIFLIPLGASPFFRGLLNAIRGSARMIADSQVADDDEGSSGGLRQTVRRLLARRSVTNEDDFQFESEVREFITSCLELRFGLVAVTPSGFLLFLVPTSELQVSEIEPALQVRIYWDNQGWYLSDVNGQHLFSFDLPIDLFNLYAEEGELSPQRALDMKQQELNEMRVVVVDEDSVRLVRFLLDTPWLEAIRRRL